MEVPVCLEESFIEFDDLPKSQMLPRCFIEPSDGLNKLQKSSSALTLERRRRGAYH